MRRIRFSGNQYIQGFDIREIAKLSRVEMYWEQLSYSAQMKSKIHMLLISKLLKVRSKINLETVREKREEKNHFHFSFLHMKSNCFHQQFSQSCQWALCTPAGITHLFRDLSLVRVGKYVHTPAVVLKNNTWEKIHFILSCSCKWNLNTTYWAEDLRQQFSSCYSIEQFMIDLPLI